MEPLSITCLKAFLFSGLLVLCAANNNVMTEEWRSRLYPSTWHPGHQDEHGRQLPDFSYAGYHMGEKCVPSEIAGTSVNVVKQPYGADNSGEEDATPIIQQAIEHVGQSGGGIVYLPGGTYRIRPQSGKNYALSIAHSNVVLMGDGPDKTFLYNSSYNMRGKDVIRIAPRQGESWDSPSGTSISLTENVGRGAVSIPLDEIEGLEPGMEVIMTHDVTEGFGRDHFTKAHRQWLKESWPGRLSGIQFHRSIVGIDRESKTVEIDIPVHYPLKKRDNARIYRAASHIREIGLKNMAIGMREHPGKGWGFADYSNPEKAAYEVHGSHLIRLHMAFNSWIKNVHTFRPEVNRGQHHMLSNGILADMSRNISILKTGIRNAQYQGGGGNGYGYTLRGNNILVQSCYGKGLRYVYSFKSMRSTGNVIHRCISNGTSDFHMHLSPTNLIDNVQMAQGEFNAGCRATMGTIPHGLTTYHSVFWNHRGGVNVTNQSDAVWLAGARNVRGHNRKYHYNNEGEGKGEMLLPESLYEDQLARRLAK